ncbi:MAG: hypothetical protein MI725_00905 [Pirellulales bacterium]|nr:hypothetical protein [Pirellulales bacterium]
MQGPDVPRGFVLIIEFSFDPNETPPFPGAPFHATRPTFYGNSGVLAHGLYEIQIVDNNRMSKKVGNVITQELLQVNRFCRLSAPNVLADADLTPAMLASDQTHWNPNVATNLIRPRLQANSGDNLMAIVTGRPVSVFDDAKANLGDPDDNATDAQIQAMARPVGIGGTWPPTNICDPSRLNTGWISALENPLAVPYKHRADGVPTNHANKPGNQWNTMRVDFTPCCYEKKLIGQQTVYEKKRNACFSTKVNGTGMFNGELETGTRSWTNRNGVRVERNAYDAANPNTSVQLMAHWGSTVKFRNPKVYPK